MSQELLRGVSIVGIGRIPIQRKAAKSLEKMGAEAVRLAMADAGVDAIDGLFAGNMLSDELQNQKHTASLIASECGFRGIEALDVRAATATGAAALRMAYFSVASGEAKCAVAVGVEKMSDGEATPALAKALHAETETAEGATLIGQNARLMQMYLERYKVKIDDFNNFAVNAHHNANSNNFAFFKDKRVTDRMVRLSPIVSNPLRLYDASPVCDGAAAVVLVRTDEARAYTKFPMKILSSSVATDWFRIADRPDPLLMFAAEKSARETFRKANVNRGNIDFFEVHDAFSIMACLLLEAVGFAPRGEGWKLAKENAIGLRGKLPISTFGGLKERGHPIGATALYQICEIVLQLTGRAGRNQVRNAKIAMMQSVGGGASTVLMHIFGV